jgi:signal transduction histidine kinase/DNA-binding response OmpR family regulator
MVSLIKVLLVEDSPDDEFLIRRELEKAGFQLELLRVTTGAQMREALADRSFDLVISDFQLPGFSGLESLQIFQESGQEIPYIVLSGMIGEDLAVEMMRRGAHDYIMKDALKRLSVAVERELRDAEARRAKKKADEEFRLLTRYYQLLSQTNQAIVRILHPKKLLERISSIAVQFGGFSWAGFWCWNEGVWEFEVGVGDEEDRKIFERVAPREFPFSELVQRVDLPASLSVVFLPIRVQGRPWGALFVTARGGQFASDEERRILVDLCADVAFALEARFESQFRRELDRQLAQEQERLALTLENVADGVVAVDSEGKIAFLNRHAEILLGLEPQNSDSICLYDLLPRATLDSFQGLKVLEFVNKKGAAFLLEVASSVVQDNRDAGISRVVLLRDVTEREKTEERLRQSEKMESIGLLAGGIAHDFNNLLTGVFGFLQLAKMNVHDPIKVESYLERALNPFQRARNLTQQLLTFAKGGQPLKKRLEVDKMVRNIADFTLSGSSILLDFQVEEGLLEVHGNEAQLTQVFENLILNAKQSMSQEGKLRISLFSRRGMERPDLERGDYVVVEVSDSGTGISSDLLGKIFDPFFTTKKEGTGLGLAICFSIVKKHGGMIEVESGVGKGATFRVYLPGIGAKGSQADEPSIPPPAGEGLVFVLDDEEYARSIASSMLEKLGYRCELFEKGADLEYAYKEKMEKHQKVDLVILDLTIKGGPGGGEVLKALKALDPHVVAIASSGYSDEKTLTQPEIFGFRDSLPKPFTLDELAEVLRRTLS